MLLIYSFPIFILICAIAGDDSRPEVDQKYQHVFESLDLPEEHGKLYLNAFPKVAEACRTAATCPFHQLLNEDIDPTTTRNDPQRWGYEMDSHTLPRERWYSKPKCPGSHIGYVKDKDSQLRTFFTQTDFGYVRQQILELRVLCEANFIYDSSLECSKYLRYCNGRNLYMDFRDLANRTEPIRYHLDVLKQGQIGGFCTLHEDRLKDELSHLSALQSWAPEMRYFESLPERPILDDNLCDVVVDKPTVIMKLDASVNMYHHFCDFFNLYASLHVNSTNLNMYNRDINILIWETYLYKSAFGETFKAFTSNPLMDLTTFKGKRVCFRNVMFPLLPRMIFGLFYNTPIINGCHSSGLFRAFSEFILHRLRIPLHLADEEDLPKIRITFLSRKTKYRNVLNEDELIEAVENLKGVEVRQVAYSRDMNFHQQLEITRNTDVFIGMHGAGLTHLLFLPDWGTVFELYNCEDAGCYKDLARLRGVRYITWENSTKVYPEDEGHHPDGDGRHAKFTNYSFDKREFVRLVEKAIDHVRDHVEYKKFIGQKTRDDEEICEKDEEEKEELET